MEDTLRNRLCGCFKMSSQLGSSFGRSSSSLKVVEAVEDCVVLTDVEDSASVFVFRSNSRDCVKLGKDKTCQSSFIASVSQSPSKLITEFESCPSQFNVQ